MAYFNTFHEVYKASCMTQKELASFVYHFIFRFFNCYIVLGKTTEVGLFIHATISVEFCDMLGTAMHQGIKIIKLIGCSSVVGVWSRYRQSWSAI